MSLFGTFMPQCESVRGKSHDDASSDRIASDDVFICWST